MSKNLTPEEIGAYIRKLYPECQFDSDNDGQVVVYTNTFRNSKAKESKLLNRIQTATYEEDNDGQIMIYTGLMNDGSEI